MTIRTLLAGLVALLLVLPASAQGTCSDCVGSGSDVAGALFQGDATAWATAEVRTQLNERAAALNTLSSDAPVGPTTAAAADAFATAPNAHTLLTRTDLPGVQADMQTEWMAHGLPEAEAHALVHALTGLIANNQVDPAALQTTLTAYNAAVNEAASTFVNEPPASFVAVRHALAVLTQDTP